MSELISSRADSKIELKMEVYQDNAHELVSIESESIPS